MAIPSTAPQVPSVQTEVATQSPIRNDIAALRRAQQALRSAEMGIEDPQDLSRAPEAASAADARSNKNARADKNRQPLNATTRETAVLRGVSLLRTMADYYGITVGELDDEQQRFSQLSDERLMRTLKALEFTSSHVLVMLSDEKAREVAIAKDSSVKVFFDTNGIGQDELSENDRQSQDKKRKRQPA